MGSTGILPLARFSQQLGWGYPVQHAPLTGRLILLVEDEPLIALDVARALRAAGASVVGAGYVESGLYTTEHPYLSAAVIDLHLGGEDGTAVCRRLRQLGVPFVVYSGYPAAEIAKEWPDVPIIPKPTRIYAIVARLWSYSLPLRCPNVLRPIGGSTSEKATILMSAKSICSERASPMPLPIHGSFGQ